MDEGLQCDGMMALGSRPGWLTFKAHARAGAGAGCPKPGARSVSRSKAANGMAFVCTQYQAKGFLFLEPRRPRTLHTRPQQKRLPAT